MAEKKKIFTKENQRQKNFRFDNDVADKLEEISKHHMRTELATMVILINQEHEKIHPKPKPKK